MELPRALMPWTEWLDLFPAELVAPVGELIRRLDLAIGPLHAPGQPGQDEPNGFEGIARRGDYDRLLLSEWLLADEAPDEFLRRAIMNEHVFLQPARIAPGGARCSVALFDAGPNQLGAPRLAHLAALIVLARRAQARGAEFQWGILQAEERLLRPEVTRGNLSHLLKARSLREARDEDVAAWRVQADALVGMEDCWLIGGRRLQSLPASQGARLLQISDPLDPESQFLNVRVTHTTSASARPQPHISIPYDNDSPSPMPFWEKGRGVEGNSRLIRLPLPPGDIGARLLREPFHNHTTELRKVKNGRKPISNLVYISENRLVARAGPDQIVVFFPPDTPTGNLAKPKLYSSHMPGKVLAVGKAGKSVALVTTTEDANQLRIVRVGAQSGRALTGTFAWPFPQISPLDANDALATAYYKLDATGAGCWNLTLNHVQIQVSAGSEADNLAARVIRPNRAFAPVLNGNFLVGPEMAGVRMGLQAQPIMAPGISGGDTEIYAEFPTAQAAHFGFGGPLAHPVYGLWALEITPGEWKILYQDADAKRGQTEVFVESWEYVAGVVALPGIEPSEHGAYKYAPALVVLDMTRRIVSLRRNGWDRSEPPAAAPITHITVSPFEPNIAYVTAQGEVVVYSLTRKAALYRLDTE